MNSHTAKNHVTSSWRAQAIPRAINVCIACLAGVLIYALLMPSLALGATCLPRAFGVPGLNGPPNWFNALAPAGNQEIRRVIDDPRWNGALKFSYGAGTEEEAAFRALYASDGGNTFLYLSWHIKADPSGLDADDRLFVGFSNSSNALALRVAPFDNFDCKEAELPIEVTAFRRTGVGVWNSITTPSWANQTTGQIRIWATATGTGTGFCAESGVWAVHMRVPTVSILGSGATGDFDLGTDFKLWYEARLETPPPIGSTEPGVKRYKWPRTGVADVVTTPIFPDPTTWGTDSDFHLSTGAADPGCTAPGVSLSSMDVGTMNNDPTTGMPAPHLILFDSTVPQASRPRNVFRVRPRNNIPGFTIAAGGISARMRIANWGSIATPAEWVDFPSGNNATHTGTILPTALGDVRTSPGWTLTDAEITTFTTGTRHRCIWVELSGNVSPPNELTFTNASVFRNMDFQAASSFSRDAEINIVGLAPAPTIGANRDVFLYVKTINMPPAPTRGTRDLIKGVGPKEVTSMVRSYEAGQIDKDQFEKTLPIYRVYVYHDTGERQNIEGVIHRVLESQPSFGFFMAHDGMLEGWRHRIEGANLEQINPRFYRLFVPNNGKATIRTVIEAVEPGGVPPQPGGFKRWGLSLHAGASIPHGNFNNVFNPGPNVGVDLEYRLHPLFSLEGIYTYHRFNGENLGIFTVPDLNLHQLSVNGKVYGNMSPVRPFFNFGGGVYHFDPSSTHGGINVGGGLQFDVTSNFAVDAMYNFHNVFTSGSNTRFSTVQGGVRFRF